MPSFPLQIDVCGWDQEDVDNVLDVLFDAHREKVISWLNEIKDDYCCCDCERRA